MFLLTISQWSHFQTVTEWTNTSFFAQIGNFILNIFISSLLFECIACECWNNLSSVQQAKRLFPQVRLLSARLSWHSLALANSRPSSKIRTGPTRSGATASTTAASSWWLILFNLQFLLLFSFNHYYFSFIELTSHCAPMNPSICMKSSYKKVRIETNVVNFKHNS